MKIKQFDALDLIAAGVSATLTNKSKAIEFDNRRRQRAESSAFVGSAIRPGEWDVIVAVPDMATRDRMLAALDADLNVERRLVADHAGVDVEGWAAVRRISVHALAHRLDLTLEPTYPTWRAVAPVTSTATLLVDGTVDVTVPGNTRAAPRVRIKPTGQRTDQTPAIGWKRRRRYTITNNADETLYNHPIRISLGSTTAIVSGGRALASGNDVRVWHEGREIPRTLITWNTAASYVWVIASMIRPGGTAVFDVMWHNAEAGAPPVLEHPQIPAFDLTVSTNSLWRYTITEGRGAWYLSSAIAPPVVDVTVPGAWHPVTTLANPDNTDDVAQAPYETFVSSGTKYRAPFSAKRAMASGLALESEGLADGVALHHPCGIVSVNVPLDYRNDRAQVTAVGAVGKFVILVRGTGAAGWDKLFEKFNEQTTTPVAITRATYAPAAAVKHVAFAVWPLDEYEVHEDAVVGRMIHVRWSDYCDVTIDGSKIAIVETQAETEIYEVATVLSVDPADGRNDAFIMRLGAAASTGATDSPRLAVELNQQVVVDGERRTVEVWDSGLTTKLSTVPNFAARPLRLQTVSGVQAAYPASDWLPLRPDPAGVDLAVTESDMGTLDVAVDVYAEWIP